MYRLDFNFKFFWFTISGKKTMHYFKVLLADLVDQNLKGHEDEIQSDMLQIAEDFFTFL